MALLMVTWLPSETKYCPCTTRTRSRVCADDEVCQRCVSMQRVEMMFRAQGISYSYTEDEPSNTNTKHLLQTLVLFSRHLGRV